jgi:tight adherence protein B
MAREILISALIFASILMLVLALYYTIQDRIRTRRRIHSRLQVPKQTRIASESELIEVRQNRSMSADGQYLSLTSLNRLILQSGTSWGLPGVLSLGLISALAADIAAYFIDADIFVGALIALAVGCIVPIAVLKAMRTRRQAKFEEQLPDAIDTVVRGLRAGHTVSVAITAAAQNLPDPVGSEFGLTSGEMTYGLDLETAMANLYARVGQPDLGLIALAVAIQAKTGGNLTEVLSNLSRIIRERFKLRRKARALSSEGRFSAIMLSLLPVVIFTVLWALSPNYYQEALRDPAARTVLGGAVIWMLFGDYVIYRMIRIRV